VKCISGTDVIRAIRDHFKHTTGMDEKDINRYNNLLMADKDSVASDYAEWAEKEVSTAFIYAFDDQANELFNRYLINASSYCKDESILDEVTGEYRDPDEKIMRALEELVPVPVESKKEFRQGIFVYKSDCLEHGKEWTWKTYMPLKEAIEKKLQSDLKNVVQLSIADSTTTHPKAKARRRKAIKSLRDKGYCPYCAKQLLSFVSGVLRRKS
jgi:serine protein kinase